LSYPRNLALKELPANELAEIVHFLEGASLPARTELEWANHLTYQNMLQLVRYWHQAAITKAANPQPVAEDLDGYFERFLVYLKAQSDTEEVAVGIYEAVRSKLERLLTTMESQGKYEAVRDYLLTVDFATLVRYVPSSTDAELRVGLEGVLP
jgi:hypothetical protein